MRITETLLKRHGGIILCRGCDHPIEEGEIAVKRRVNNTIRYFHQNCIYTEKKPYEEAGVTQELVYEGELKLTNEGLSTGKNKMDDNGNWIEEERDLSGDIITAICKNLFPDDPGPGGWSPGERWYPDEIDWKHSKRRAKIRITIEVEWLEEEET